MKLRGFEPLTTLDCQSRVAHTTASQGLTSCHWKHGATRGYFLNDSHRVPTPHVWFPVSGLKSGTQAAPPILEAGLRPAS